MRVGVILPTFNADATSALAAAQEAERVGLHGVFAYGHLWPMGRPGRPALAPLPVLAAIAMRTEAISVGTLVARVGITSDEVLVEELLTLDAVSGGRLVAGLGTGDRKSAAENLAYGLGFPPAQERRERVASVASRLLDEGVTTWVGGGSAATDAVARATGAVLNLWAALPHSVAEAAASGEVTWAGMLPEERASAADLLAELARAGASWAVMGWPGSCAPILDAVSAANVTVG
jgi:alkanesulfonate monooxygenase SsuD/methylene tetrahydromethanopterin reductase-like flavin-dependent oxidoreductase (luciferase family)